MIIAEEEKMKKKVIISVLSMILVGCNVLIGCGTASSNNEKIAGEDLKETVNPKETEKADTIEASIVNIEDTKKYYFLDDTVMYTRNNDETISFYVWDEESYTEQKGYKVDQNVIIDRLKYHILFWYCIIDSKVYIAHEYCDECNNLTAYTLGQELDQVYIEVGDQGDVSYYYFDLNTYETEKISVLDRVADKNSSVIDFQISKDGTYAIASVEEKETTAYYLCNLETDTYEELTEKLQEQVRGVTFFGEHAIRYFVENEKGKVTYKTWNVGDAQSVDVLADVELESTLAILPEWMLYMDAAKVDVVSFENRSCIKTLLEQSEFITIFAAENGKKCLVVSYEEDEETEEFYITKGILVDLQNMEAKQISNIDTKCRYENEIEGGWTSENTFTFMTSEELESYTFAE